MAKISNKFVAPLAKTLLNVALLSLPGAGAIASAGVDTAAAAAGASDAAKRARKRALRQAEREIVKTLEGAGANRALVRDSVDIARQALNRNPAAIEEIIHLGQDPERIAIAVLRRSFGEGAGIESAERDLAERLIASVYVALFKTGRVPGLPESAALYTARSTRAFELERERASRDRQAEEERLVDTRRDRVARKSQLQLSQRTGRNCDRPFRHTRGFDEVERLLASDWRNDVRTRVNELVQFLTDNRLEPQLLKRLESIQTNSDLELVANQLREIRIQPHVIRSHEEDLAAIGEPARDGLVGLPLWRAARWLARQSRTPEFNWVALISGDWGSGKSRLIDELAGSSPQHGAVFVYLQLDGSQTLADELFRRMGDWTDQPVHTIAQLGKTIASTTGGNLVVVLDDFDEAVRRRQSYLAQFQDLVESNTDVQNVRWVVVADSLRRDALLSRSNRDFWRHYGIRSESSKNVTIGGWIELDAVNREDTVGIELLAEHASAQERGVMAQLRRDAATFDSHAIYLCSPQPAWVQIEANRGGKTLSAIYQPDAIRAWWKVRREALASDEHSVSDVELAVELLAKEFGNAETAISMRRAIDSLAKAFAPSMSDERGRLAMIENLRQSGLIYTADAIDTTMLRPRADLLWGQRIADQIFKKLGRQLTTAGLIEQLAPWAAIAEGDWTAEAVIQLSMARAVELDSSTLSFVQLARTWHASPEMPDSHLWAAAVSAPLESQRLLASQLPRFGLGEVSDREVYLLLRFADLVADEAMAGLRRLQLAKGLFERTRELGLGAYLAHVIERSLALVNLADDGDHHQALQSLIGIDSADEAEPVSKAYVKAVLDENLDASRWLVTVHQFLSGAGRQVPSVSFPRPPSQVSSPTESQTEFDHRRNYFWQFLVRDVVDSIVRRDGIAAFTAFLGAGWLDLRNRTLMPRHVATQMHIEVNVAYGHLYLFGTSREQDDVIELLDELIASGMPRLSSDVQRDIAFFIIRHSRVVSRSRPARLDERVRERLDALLVDPTFVRRNNKWLDRLHE